MDNTSSVHRKPNNESDKKFSFNTYLTSIEEIRSFLDKGLEDIDKGNVVKAKKFFEDFRRAHAND